MQTHNMQEIFLTRYLYWLLENISERVKCRPPSTLERSRIDMDFPDYIHAEGCWNTFMSSGKRLMTRAHLNIILNNESLIRQSDVNVSRAYLRKFFKKQNDFKLIPVYLNYCIKGSPNGYDICVPKAFGKKTFAKCSLFLTVLS